MEKVAKKEIELLLEDYSIFRERKNKNRAVAYLLLRKYHLHIESERLGDILVEASNMDRYWRQVLEERPELRGTDYNDRQKVAMKKMSELGYHV